MNPTKRSELRRVPARGSHDWETINQILDAGFLAHVGFCVDGQPFVIPTLYGRDGRKLYLHGSAASRMLRELESGVPACVTVTLVDGLVLARSAFDHSMNYRSVVAFGNARTITDEEQKVECLRIMSEHLIAGRWNEVRTPSEKELKATAVLEFSIEEASSKARSGPPIDDESDYAVPVWAGVLPLGIQSGSPVPDDNLVDGVTVPDYVRRYSQRFNGHNGNSREKSIARKNFFTWRMFIAIFALLLTALVPGGVSAKAQQPVPLVASEVRQSLDDAWWTGPMLAPSAATLPRGHFLIEPYLYDVTSPHSNGFGSLTYVNYGLADKLTVGMIPIFGFNKISNGLSSSNVGVGDLTLQSQYGLTKFHDGSWIPTTSLAVQETLPTGKYDQLGDRPSDGLGSGAYTTTLALYSQTYFWLPNARILRMRFNVSEALSKNVNLRDVSVYGTEAGFRGHAEPGASFLVDASWEYSLTRRWVLASDATYRHNGNTLVIGNNVLNRSGVQTPSQVRTDSGSSEAFAFAPAVEYSWKPNLGVLLGTRLILGGHRTGTSVTPAVAINFVH